MLSNRINAQVAMGMKIVVWTVVVILSLALGIGLGWILDKIVEWISAWLYVVLN